MNNTIIYTEEGNIILPYKITSSSPFFIKYLKLAKPKDLSIGIHYYQMMPLGKGYLDQVRKKVRKETKEEYAEYKNYLKVICRKKQCYVLKLNLIP